MKYITRELKGTFGYIKKQTRFEIVKTALLFLMAFGIFFIGYYTLGTKKSLWSVLAVLSLLPASKSLVGLIMLLRYKSLSSDEYNHFRNVVGSIGTLYENVLTTTEKSYYLPVISYAKGSLIAFGALKSEDIQKLSSHLSTVLNNAGHKDITIKIFNNENDFASRLVQMNDSLSDDTSKRTEDIFNTIKAVSL